MNPEKLLSAVSIIPESAPFTDEQRSWLNGFFAGMTGMEEIYGEGTGGTDVAQPPATVEEEEDFPWNDDTLELEERLKLSEGRPYERRLMSAMAQLDCGSCGYLCKTYSEAIASGDEPNLTLCSPGGKETARAVKQLVKLNAQSGDSAPAATNGSTNAVDAAGDPKWSRKNPFTASLISNEKVTGEGSAKDVRHVEIDLTGSDLEYTVGDALGIVPTNCPELVDMIVAETQLHETDNPHFLDTMDLTTAPEELAEWFVQNLLDADEKKKAEAILADDDLLDSHDVLDLLQEFRSIRIPCNDLIQCLTPLNPRLYSIASSLKAHPSQVHLTVGKVTYEKKDRLRKGVASTMLAERVTPGSPLKVFIQASHGFTVPPDLNAPMIMVGPGTGIAPFLAFLEEREATGAKGDNWLFFGDQKSETDFLYQQRLEGYLERGVLKRLDTAFSRDQAEKIYVQDRMRESGAEIFHWLESGGYFMVCGDASRMAKDVDRTLHEIIAQHGKMSDAAAQEYVKQLAAEHRYGRDVY